MAFLFDTDAISEVLKPRPLPGYMAWLRAIPRAEQFTSAVVVGELFKGAYRSADAPRHLRNIETRVLPAVSVLPYDVEVARVYGAIQAQLSPVPSLRSLLFARLIPPGGGGTEFASGRAAYPSLPRPSSAGPRPPSPSTTSPGPATRSAPANLFLDAHASHIGGLPVEEGRVFLKELQAHVTQPQFCYRHEWQEGDLVVWDNRCVLHRATRYDTTRYKRLMQGTTVSGDPREFAGASA